MSVSQNIAQRVQALAGPEPAEETPTAESASEPASSTPLAGDGSGADSAAVESPNAETHPEPEAEVQATKHQLLKEKLDRIREKSIATRLKSERQQLEHERKQTAAEKAKWDALRKGTFKEAISALGRDPYETYLEMEAEAKEAGKPENQRARDRQEFERQMAERVEPLVQKVQGLEEQLAAERGERFNVQFTTDFQNVVQQDEFKGLRIEYDDADLFRMVDAMLKHPTRVFDQAERLNVRLTAMPGKVTMLDILNVLRATHEEHEKGREARRSRLATTQTQAATQSPAPAKHTVNGTAERRNAEPNTLGNQLASARSSDANKPRRSRKERVMDMIRRSG